MNKNPYEIINAQGTKPVILICDHASHFLPPQYKNLGLQIDQLKQHIGWDIGAAGITRAISSTINATAVLCSISRLLIDANRSPNNSDCIPDVSDEIVIPGNKNISKSARMKRIKEYFWPYHNAISQVIRDHKKKYTQQKNLPIIFSVHTFTSKISSQKNTKRPWHAGVLWNRDQRVSRPLISLLRKHPDNLNIGDNQPYSGKEYFFSLDYHAGSAGFPHCAIEVRQDLVDTTAGAIYWAKIISELLEEILLTEELLEPKYY